MVNFVLNDRKRRMNDRTLALARAAFDAAVAEKRAGMFTIRQRIRVVKRHPIGEASPAALPASRLRDARHSTDMEPFVFALTR